MGRRLVLWLEYDGADFHGWQLQPGQRTVQGELEAALATILGHPARLIASGRTDAGVHAAGQVAHFDTASGIHPWKLRLGLDSLTGGDISVLDCREAAPDFHAQFDAVRKTYRYRILARRPPSALRRNRCWHIPAPLRAEAMHEAAQALAGEHDFASFCRERSLPESSVRQMERLDVRAVEDEIWVEATANGFLHQMVRAIVGSLAEVGRGERPVSWLGGVRDACDRRLAGKTAPPQGLCLLHVEYGDKTPPPCPQVEGWGAT